MKFSPLRVLGFGRNSYKLPLSVDNDKRRENGYKMTPKYRKFGSGYSKEKFVNFNLGLVVVLSVIFVLKLFFLRLRVVDLNLFLNDDKDGGVVQYDTEILSASEYYNYDFKDFDSKVQNKFDGGFDNFLLENYNVKSVEDIKNSEERETLKREYDELVDSTIEYYDLKQFSGTPQGNLKREHVLLCIPLRDAEDVLPLMFKNLMNLTYPHELIDVAFLVSDCSKDDHTLDSLIQYSRFLQNGTLPDLFHEYDKYTAMKEKVSENTDDSKLYLKYMNQDYMKKVKKAFAPPFPETYDKPFRSVQIYQKDFGQSVGQSFSDRHDVKVQGIRRKLMGRARNWLMANALKPYHSWVYWRDADVELCPGTVIEDLMSKNLDVIVPNVWRPLPEFLNGEQPYDLNSWMESKEGLELAKKLHEDDVIVEGYAEYPTWRVHLAYIREADGNPNQVVHLDGVGGVSILARAKLFRAGVHFPAFTFENHAETEGFGKMAKKMGFQVGGLPHYTLWHIYEPSNDDLMEIAAKEREARKFLK